MNIDVNWLAVLVAAIVNFVVGWLWFGPIFGKTWKNLMGITSESMGAMKMTPTMAMVGGFITSLIMAYVLAVVLSLAAVASVGSALGVAFWVWLGFVATVTSGMWLWEGKPFKLFALVALEHLVGMSLAAVVLTMWM